MTMRSASAARAAVLAILTVGTLACAKGASAEPYLAVSMGLKCVSCHTNPTGGGKRNALGVAFARAELPTRTVERGRETVLPGEISRWLSVGGDLRARLDAVDSPGTDRTSEFGVERGTVYAAVFGDQLHDAR